MPLVQLNSVEEKEIKPFNGGSADTIIEKGRIAAEAHRRVRYKVQKMVRPGVSLQEIARVVEESTRALLGGELNGGIGFPVGLSLNNCAAHYTPNPGDPEIVLTDKDVLKVDFGTHVDGRIMDSAFTVAFDPVYENLLVASKEATEAGIKALGVDVRVTDIGGAIKEAMSGYELEINGKTIPIRPVENLSGHSIGQYEIHGGISIPSVRNRDNTRIVEDAFYAIETFATTGKGMVMDGPNCSHYALDKSVKKPVNNKRNKKVLDCIAKNMGTLPFCPRHIDFILGSEESFLPNVRSLSLLKILRPYPPLYDVKDSVIAQFEHTIYLGENGKEVLTLGDDY